MGVMQIGAFADISGGSPALAARQAVASPPRRLAMQATAPDMPSPASGYASPRPRASVLLGIVLFHLIAIAVLATMQFSSELQADRERLTVVAIDEPPPPAPRQPQPVDQAAVPPVSSPVILPDPPVSLPDRVLRVASPEIAVPVQAVPPAPSVRPPAPPAPSRMAAPAPITPPDFRASQLDNPAPAYPYLSRRAREEGVVLLRVLVNPEGRATRLEIEDSSGFGRLDEAALKTVRKWRFVPAMQAGSAVEAWVLVPVTFSLG